MLVGQCHVPIANGALCTLHVKQQKCKCCHRHLRDGLFTPGSIECNVCVRKKPVAQDMIQRGKGRMATSVNNTFITQDIDGNENDVDALLFIRVQTSNIRDMLYDGLRLRT